MSEDKQLLTATDKPTGETPAKVSAQDAMIATLTPQEKMFCHYYMEAFNWNDAAERAGYPRDRGLRLYRQENVRVFIGTLLDKRQSRSIIDAEWIEMELMEQLEAAKGNREISLVTAQGATYEAAKYDAPTALRIVETLAKSTTFNKEKETEKGDVTINIDFSKVCNVPPSIKVQNNTWDEGNTYDQ